VFGNDPAKAGSGKSSFGIRDWPCHGAMIGPVSSVFWQFSDGGPNGKIRRIESRRRGYCVLPLWGHHSSCTMLSMGRQMNGIVDTVVPIALFISIAGGFTGFGRMVMGRRGGGLQLAICATIFIITILLTPFLYSL
jgi:hypothetical protein